MTSGAVELFTFRRSVLEPHVRSHVLAGKTEALELSEPLTPLTTKFGGLGALQWDAWDAVVGTSLGTSKRLGS